MEEEIKKEGIFANESLAVKLLLFVGLSFFGFLLGTVITAFLIPDFTQADGIRWGQFIASLFSFAMPAVACAFLFGKRGDSFLCIDKALSTTTLLLAIVAMLAINPFINWLHEWNQQIQLPESLATIDELLRKLEQEAETLMQMLLAEQSISGLLLNLFFIALMPAITEELFFRGALQRIFEEKMNLHLSVWITAIIFSAYHFQFFGFFPRVFMGAMLGYMAVWSKSLYLPIAAHFANNAAAVLVSFFVARGALANVDVDKIGAGSQWGIALCSLVAVVALMLMLRKKQSVSTRI